MTLLHRLDQDVAARAALVCHGGTSGGYQAEWTYWDSIEQAREAEAELAHPCGPLCIGVHSAIRVQIAAPRPWSRTTATRTRAPST